jgi:hypothetical protein
MLFLLRKIRQKLVADNKVKNYLLYAVGEIILVVVGILIAVSLNNWNTHRKDLERSEQTLENLKIELKEANGRLNSIIGINQKVVESSDSFIKGTFNLDSIQSQPGIIFQWTNYSPIKLDLPIVFQETSAERIILNNDSLAARLRVIKLSNQRIEGSLYYLDEFWNNQVAPYFIKSETMVLFHQHLGGVEIAPELLTPLYEDEEYKNLTAMSNLLTKSYIESTKELSQAIEKALELIDDKE